MNPEDIRCVLDNQVSVNPTSTGSTKVLVEIAAQLAEMNQTLKRIVDTLYADGMAKYGK